MNAQKDDNAPSPDRFVQRDVSDLKEVVGRFDERIDNLKENMATKVEIASLKTEMANKRYEGLKLALTLIVPVLAAAVGALAIMFSGVVQTVIP